MKYHLYKQSYPLLLTFILITSCNAQNKTDIQDKSVNDSKAVATSDQKIIVPGGADPHASFRCSMMDKAGNLWFGTTGAGIYRYDGKYFKNFSAKDGLANTVVFSLVEDNNGHIWVGTEDGVFRSDGNTFSRVAVPGFEDSDSNMFNDINSANAANQYRSKKAVYKIIQDTKGNIWFGTEAKGLYRYDGKSFTNFQYANNDWKIVPNDSLRNHKGTSGLVQYILEDSDGNIWFSNVGYGNGLRRYDGKTFTHFKLSSQSGGHVFYMIEDKTGNIWMATRDDGVCRFNGTSFECFTTKSSGYCDRGANTLLQDRNGNIWIGSAGNVGTDGGCVTVYDGKSFTSISTKALRNDRVWTMIEDKSGNIWLGAKEMSLYRYDGKTFTDFSDTTAKQ
jgi:ligand-binding sensor domain-containing protein